MRGEDEQLQTGMFSYVALEDRIPADHPLRGVRKLVDLVLAAMSKDFDGPYAQGGMASIAPEGLRRALLLQVFYSVRCERLLMEQLNYICYFRCFVGLEIDDLLWNHAVFSKKRDPLLNQDVTQRFFAQVNHQAAGLMSDGHFTADGTLIEAWAAGRIRRKDKEGGPAVEEIFTASHVAIEPLPRAPTPTRDAPRSRRGSKLSCAIWDIPWRTGTVDRRGDD